MQCFGVEDQQLYVTVVLRLVVYVVDCFIRVTEQHSGFGTRFLHSILVFPLKKPVECIKFLMVSIDQCG